MNYEIEKKKFTWLKVGIIWNLIAMCLNYVFVPYRYYYNGYSMEESVAILITILILSIPVLIGDIIVYKKLKSNATKKVIIAGIVLSIISLLLLVKLPSLLLLGTYINILIRNKPEEVVSCE